MNSEKKINQTPFWKWLIGSLDFLKLSHNARVSVTLISLCIDVVVRYQGSKISAYRTCCVSDAFEKTMEREHFIVFVVKIHRLRDFYFVTDLYDRHLRYSPQTNCLIVESDPTHFMTHHTWKINTDQSNYFQFTTRIYLSIFMLSVSQGQISFAVVGKFGTGIFWGGAVADAFDWNPNTPSFPDRVRPVNTQLSDRKEPWYIRHD